MQLTALQKAAAQATVNIFETGSIRGNYSDVTLMSGDTGQLTYGRSQTTLASGNLFLLIQDYAGNSAGAYCTSFQPYLGKLQACDASLNGDMQFRGLLKDAGEDPVMQECQDAFFDRVYWDPAMRSADAVGVKTALGAAVVYDSTVRVPGPRSATACVTNTASSLRSAKTPGSATMWTSDAIGWQRTPTRCCTNASIAWTHSNRSSTQATGSSICRSRCAG